MYSLLEVTSDFIDRTKTRITTINVETFYTDMPLLF